MLKSFHVKYHGKNKRFSKNYINNDIFIIVHFWLNYTLSIKKTAIMVNSLFWVKITFRKLSNAKTFGYFFVRKCSRLKFSIAHP